MQYDLLQIYMMDWTIFQGVEVGDFHKESGGGDGEGGLMEVVGDEIFPTAHLIYGPFVYKFFIILTFYKYVHILFIRFSAAIYDTWCISLDALRNSQIELGIVYVDRGYQLEKQVEVVYCS